MICRGRLVFLFLGFFVFALCVAPLLPTFYYLARLPFVWDRSASQALLSAERDLFDITFESFSANYSTADSGTEPLIPARLHHIHLGTLPPAPEWIAARAECLRHHDSWEAYMWDDAKASQFVSEFYPHLEKMWKGYPYVVQRVDALRYMILAVHGGAILDYDLACKRSMEPLRRFEFVAPVAHPTGFSVGMMLASPNSSFVHTLVHSLPRFKRRWLLLPYATVMFSTGCHYASTIYTMIPDSLRTGARFLTGTPDKPSLHMLNGLVDTPLFRHLGSSSWHNKDAQVISLFKRLDRRVLLAVSVFVLVASFTFTLVACLRRYRASSSVAAAARGDVEATAVAWLSLGPWKKYA
ncbi:hypothetical protein BJY01DRAFT_263440 [Aspergillus pseudoustus]|uniref:Nucleotide-diphospho-sugar transferase n=1 Tax=Aspergillus pseudoustus TaxID=1810923 RepID=A0ABR4K3P9_9EURO